MSTYRIAADTGGTFTDVVLWAGSGDLEIAKSPTVRGRAYAGLAPALAEIGARLGLSAKELLGQTGAFLYGTTRSTNAIVEGKTARTAFFTTAGFPDILLLREGGKPARFKQFRYGDPFVPRHLTWEIDERMDADGAVHRPLDETSVLKAIDGARAAGCEAVGVCLLWSILNPAHELRVGELITRHWPEAAFTLSHLLNPIVREYRRASSTVIDASLKPLMQEHITALASDLRDAGFEGNLLVATSIGGAWPPAEVAARPIYSVGSGPSMSPIAGISYARQEFELPDEEMDLIVCDTGGTTFDVSVVSNGQVHLSPETWLGGRWIGHITGVKSVDVKSIGAGGGSIVRVDEGGLLRVGPESAGASPGPACYGLGGDRATITDAALVLGYIDPDYFLGGSLELDAAAALDAIRRDVAAPLGVSAEEAAWAAVVVASANIVGAMKEITIAQGLDPRELRMVAGGGAAGLTAALIAADLGCEQILVPKNAAAFSACGCLFSDLVMEFLASAHAETRDLPVGTVNQLLRKLAGEAEEFLHGLEQAGLRTSRIEPSVEARYPRQVWEISVPLPGIPLCESDVAKLEATFHSEHERLFAVSEPGQYLECISWKVRATGVMETPTLVGHEPVAAGEAVREYDLRDAFFGGHGAVAAKRFRGPSLPPGASIEGPAVILEPTTTIVVYPGTTASVTKYGNYVLDVGAASAPPPAELRVSEEVIS